MTRKKRESREVWAERVAAWRLSGLSGSEFARQQGLTLPTLYRWGQVLGELDSSRARTSGFAEVVVKPSAYEEPPMTMEVALGNGRVLRVSGAIEVPRLVAVIEALESC